VEETVVYMVTIATRIFEMWLLEKNSLNAKGNQITQVIHTYTVAVKKDGFCHKKYLELVE